jgi:hypothetical protein
MRRLLALAAAGLVVLSAAPAAIAAAPVPVDPSTLTPPPNPNFDWSCLARGGGIVCDGTEVTGAIDDNSDPAFSCDGTPILTTFTQTLTARRSHDAAGRVIRNHTVGTFDERWRLAGSDVVLTSRGRWSLTVDYAVPGDVTSRTNTYTGGQLTVSAPGEGVIFQNTGRVRLNWDESEVLSVSGHQDMMEDFEGSIAAACAAFAR